MKTKILAVLLTLGLSGAAANAQDHSVSHQKQSAVKKEKATEMSKPSSEPCCPEMKSGSCCEQSDKKTEKMDHSKMDHSQMDSKATKDVAVVYTCPMHPEVKSDKSGKCPKCGMDLIKKK